MDPSRDSTAQHHRLRPKCAATGEPITPRCAGCGVFQLLDSLLGRISFFCFFLKLDDGSSSVEFKKQQNKRVVLCWRFSNVGFGLWFGLVVMGSGFGFGCSNVMQVLFSPFLDIFTCASLSATFFEIDLGFPWFRLTGLMFELQVLFYYVNMIFPCCLSCFALLLFALLGLDFVLMQLD